MNKQDERKYPYGSKVTLEAGLAEYPVVGRVPDSAGLLLYAHVYEAKWKAVQTLEICPRWNALPETERMRWEAQAREIASLVSNKSSSVGAEQRGAE